VVYDGQGQAIETVDAAGKSIKVRPVGFDGDEYAQKLCVRPGEATVDVSALLEVVPPGTLSILFKGFGDGLSAGFRVKVN
jgi:hypothetical protein